MTELSQILDKLAGIDKKVDRLDQGINGGSGAVGLATQVEVHDKFIRENRPMIVIGRMLTYAGLGAVASTIVIFTLRDTILKVLGVG